MIFRYTLAWAPMILLAIGNGALREYTYGRRLSELQAHQLSTLIGLLLFAGYIFGLSEVWPLQSSSQATVIGAVWLALTLGFEFFFGHYVSGRPWAVLLHDYNIFAGRLWLFLLIWIAIAPWVFYLLQTS